MSICCSLLEWTKCNKCAWYNDELPLITSPDHKLDRSKSAHAINDQIFSHPKWTMRRCVGFLMLQWFFFFCWIVFLVFSNKVRNITFISRFIFTYTRDKKSSSLLSTLRWSKTSTRTFSSMSHVDEKHEVLSFVKRDTWFASWDRIQDENAKKSKNRGFFWHVNQMKGCPPTDSKITVNRTKGSFSRRRITSSVEDRMGDEEKAKRSNYVRDE